MDAITWLALAVIVVGSISGAVLFFVKWKRSTMQRGSAVELFYGESPDIRVEAATLFADPDKWLYAPNAHFGGRTPAALIEAGEEQKVRDVLRALKHGMVS